jgi:hypothetical protein
LTLARPAFASLARFWYLGLTPAFALLDYTTGIDLRVSLLDGHRLLHGAYYVVSFLCGIGAYVRPEAARAIAVGESSANIAILVIGVFTAYFAVLESAAGPGAVVNPFTPEAVANLVISALWAYVAYARSLAGRTP